MFIIIGNVKGAFATVSSSAGVAASKAANKVSTADPKQIALDTATWMNEHRVETAVYGVCGLSVAAPVLIAGPALGIAGFGSAGVAHGTSISMVP